MASNLTINKYIRGFFSFYFLDYTLFLYLPATLVGWFLLTAAVCILVLSEPDGRPHLQGFACLSDFVAWTLVNDLKIAHT